MKTLPKLSLMAIAYLASFPIGAVTGIIHPACFAYVGALMPLLFAFIYLNSAATLRNFGVPTILNGFLSLVWFIMGEADATFAVGIVVLTVTAEIVRWCCGYDTLRGVRLSFVPFAFSFFAYTFHWWTDTEGSLAAAVEEMRPGYDALMRPVIDNTALLIVVLLLTIPIAIVAMRLAERVLIKQTDKLD